MDVLVILKLIHILAAMTAVGANVTYTYWLRRARLDRDRLVWTIEGVRRLDNTIATPAYVVVLVTGLAMVAGGLFSFTTGWILAALALYIAVVIVAIALYAPAVRAQLAAAEADPASPAYAAAAARSNRYGIITLSAVLAIVVLMVTKPF